MPTEDVIAPVSVSFAGIQPVHQLRNAAVSPYPSASCPTLSGPSCRNSLFTIAASEAWEAAAPAEAAAWESSWKLAAWLSAPA